MEKIIKPLSGFLMLIIAIICISIGFYLAVSSSHQGASSSVTPILCIILLVAGLFLFRGLTVVNPNQSIVCTFFGSYAGSIKKNSLLFVNPLYKKSLLLYG